MFINQVEIFQFRNIEKAAIQLSPELNFIVGRNGQGKTNLVEAVHVLSAGKSFRTTSAKQLIGWNYEQASVACSLSEAVSDLELRVILKPRGREYLVNGRPTSSLSDFVGKLTTVSFSPDDLQIVRGGPVERRKFLDKHIVDAHPAALKHFGVYQKALKNKNSLLKSERVTPHEISPWNRILAREGIQIHSLRREFLHNLEEEVNTAHSAFGATDGRIELALERSGAFAGLEDSTEAEYLHALEANFTRERIIKSSELGIHRDDIRILLGSHDSRQFASQGQVRSVVLSLKLGVISLLERLRADSPVILLDDVDSELDRRRSDAFFDLLLQQRRQVIITGTEFPRDRLNSSSSNRVFSVESGTFSLLENEELSAL